MTGPTCWPERAEWLADKAGQAADPVGVADHGSTPIRRLTEAGRRQARAPAARAGPVGGLAPSRVTLGIMLLVLDKLQTASPLRRVQYAGELGADDPVVYRNDALTADEALALQPAAIVRRTLHPAQGPLACLVRGAAH